MTTTGISKFEMRIDLNVLNHLGMNLYSNIPAVLSEVVANSWDADAEVVEINIDPSRSEIIIKDDGNGMGLDDINAKYLTIGYARRENGEVVTPKYRRPVMGRKGIGKLSLFSIAKTIEVYSKKNEEKNAFRMNAEKIRKQITSSSSRTYNPEEIDHSSIDFAKGTKIVLKDLKKRLSHAEAALKKRLARRFSIIGASHDFRVFLNNEEITIEDRNYFHKIEYLWYFGEESSYYEDLSINKVHSEKRKNILNGGHQLSGWLGLVKESGELQDGDDNLNKIVLLVRGKLAKEDLLEDFREGGLYTKYLFGEIKADFLDDDEKPDIATSSRQDIFEEDERYIALKEFLFSELKHIQNKRAEYKSQDAEKEILQIPSIKEWYNDLGSDSRNKAKKLFSKINQIAVDKEHKKQLLSHGVLAFESLRYKDALDSLETISLSNLDEFLRVFREFDDIEATLYYKITKERLTIIKKLKEKVHDENALERILQEHLFQSLWLLDPSWERGTDTPYMEQRIETEFGKITANLTEEERKGRIDIKYKTPVGKHVIVELKRASVSTDTYELQRQVDKYRSGLGKILTEISPQQRPVIEAICVVGRQLRDWENPEKIEESVKAMSAKNTRVVTYQQLIENSYRAYSAYLSQNTRTGNLLRLIKKIEEEITDG